MTPQEIAFLKQNVEPTEAQLLALPLGGLFTGQLYTSATRPLLGLELENFADGTMSLSPAEVGRLFMAPDESIVSVFLLGEQDDGTPAGVNVKSDNDFVEEGSLVEVVAYQDATGPGVRLDSLHLARVMLDQDAPARLCTVAFGLMACTAYRRGFKQITLFAGGNGPPANDPDGDMVGYLVWPKFGFDAPLVAADLNAAPHLGHCRSVLDLVRIDSAWWEQHGRGKEMAFDLSPGSQSWNVLLNYLFEAFAEDLL